MRSALEVGYRLLDTAVSYDNEVEVGIAVRSAPVERDEIQVSTKIRGRDHDESAATKSVEDSLRRLGLEYLDLCLIHWPNPRVGRYREAWRALVKLRDRGLVTSLGVSNFTESHLHDIIDDSGVTPAVNQIEVHPYFPQRELLRVHDQLGIRTECWSPLGESRPPFDETPVTRAAELHRITPAQVVLRWHVQRGSIPLPKSSSPARQRENLDVFDVELSDEEVAAITGLGRRDGRLPDGDPEQVEYP